MHMNNHVFIDPMNTIFIFRGTRINSVKTRKNSINYMALFLIKNSIQTLLFENLVAVAYHSLSLLNECSFDKAIFPVVNN